MGRAVVSGRPVAPRTPPPGAPGPTIEAATTRPIAATVSAVPTAANGRAAIRDRSGRRMPGVSAEAGEGRCVAVATGRLDHSARGPAILVDQLCDSSEGDERIGDGDDDGAGRTGPGAGRTGPTAGRIGLVAGRTGDGRGTDIVGAGRDALTTVGRSAAQRRVGTIRGSGTARRTPRAASRSGVPANGWAVWRDRRPRPDRTRRTAHIPIDRSMTAGRRVRPASTLDENRATIASRPRTTNAAARSSTVRSVPPSADPRTSASDRISLSGTSDPDLATRERADVAGLVRAADAERVEVALRQGEVVRPGARREGDGEP